MATTRARKAAKIIGKTRTEAEALIQANYSPSYAKSGLIKYTKGWKKLMNDYLPDELVVQRHQELINKREVIKKFNGEGELIDQPDTQAVSKGVDMAYKLKGHYAPEKHANINLNLDATTESKIEKALGTLGDIA